MKSPLPVRPSRFSGLEGNDLHLPPAHYPPPEHTFFGLFPWIDSLKRQAQMSRMLRDKNDYAFSCCSIEPSISLDEI
jgi:hypothetical protein